MGARRTDPCERALRGDRGVDGVLDVGADRAGAAEDDDVVGLETPELCGGGGGGGVGWWWAWVRSVSRSAWRWRRRRRR